VHTAQALTWAGRAVWWAGGLCMASLYGHAILLEGGL
jgi:hypothetical protein